MEQQQARSRRDRDFHLLGEREAAASLEVFVRQKCLNQPEQPRPLVRSQRACERDVVLHDAVPVSGIEPVGSRSDVVGKRRKTADAPTYPRTMRTNTTPTTASSSILVPPAVESLRRHELLGQRLDRFRSLAHDVGAERIKPSGQRVRVADRRARSEEHTSELQSQSNLVCRLLLEKKKK